MVGVATAAKVSAAATRRTLCTEARQGATFESNGEINPTQSR
jgi:hypothetical protein